MYLESMDLLRQIALIASEVSARTGRQAELDGFSAMPNYGGNIMLRFRLQATRCTAKELEQYEKLISSLTEGRFLFDFVGDIYEKIGLTPEAVGERLYRLSVEYQNEPFRESAHRERVLEDALVLLKQAGVSRFARVWEIQPGNPTTVLILGRQNALFKQATAPDGRNICVVEVNEEECDSLMRVVFAANRKHVSVASMLLQMTDPA